MKDLQAMADIFGRGTAAGDAIYKCYVKPTKESTLDPELLERLQKWRLKKEAAEAALQRPRPLPKSKAMINCPRVGLGKRMTDEERAARRLIALPHKKPASVIQQEARAFRPSLPPLGKRPLITMEEKERLALIFQLGELPPKPTEFTGANKVRYAKIDRRFKLKDRFDSLAKYVETLREELRKLEEHKADDGADEGSNEQNVGDAINILDTVHGRRVQKQNMLNKINVCVMKRQLTATIGEVLEEMKIIDADIRQLEDD